MNFQKFLSRNATAAANTVVACPIRGRDKLITRVLGVAYLSGNTAHTVSLLKPVKVGSAAHTTLATTALSANDTAITCAAAVTDFGGNAPASGDYIAVAADNGEAMVCKLSAWNATTKVATVDAPAGGAGVLYAAAVGNKIWFMGAPTDVQNAQFTSVANTTITRGYTNNVGVWGGDQPGDPIAVLSSNGTAAGIVEVAAAYAKLAGG